MVLVVMVAREQSQKGFLTQTPILGQALRFLSTLANGSVPSPAPRRSSFSDQFLL